jgi:hypothetical protein
MPGPGCAECGSGYYCGEQPDLASAWPTAHNRQSEQRAAASGEAVLSAALDVPVLVSVILTAEGVGDALVGGVDLAVDAMGVDVEQDDDAVPGAAGNLGGGHARVQGQGHARVPQVVRPPGERGGFAEAGMPFGQPISAETLSQLAATGWELYHVEAGKYNVMPVDGRGLARMIAEKPLAAAPRDRCTYRPGTQSIPYFAAPGVLNRPHSITADVEIPPGGAEGVLLCQGTAADGYSLFVQDGKLRYVHNYVGRAVYAVESDQLLQPGPHSLRFEFEPTGKPNMAHGKSAPGRLQL